MTGTDRAAKEKESYLDPSNFNTAAKETSGPNSKTPDEWTSLLCEHAQHVGMETRKRRRFVSISQWMATISRMQRNFLSGPWIHQILFSMLPFTLEDCSYCFEIPTETL